MNKRPKALAIVALALASVIAPPERVMPSAWAVRNLVVPDGPRAGEKFDLSLTPYLREPLDALAPDSGVNKVSSRKSAQTGFTLLGIAFVGHSIDRDPCRMMVVQPTDSALSEFMNDKLGEAITNSPALKRKIYDQVSRSRKGSTTYVKRFAGGALTAAIATSTADLRSKTIKKVFKDEVSEYEADLNQQGSPHEMIARRYESFLRSGDWKELNVSTPTLKGQCYITEEFEAGDQRFWHVACPGCGAAMRFDPLSGNFKFETVHPFRAHYVSSCCGTVIGEDEKYDLVAQSPYGWVAANPGGRHRSYHFDSLSSPFVPWNVIAERIVKAGDDPAKLKTLYNLTFGLAYEMKGDAPDHQRLMERREDYPRMVVPPLGLILTGAADVQMQGIWYEILATAPDGQEWTVDYGYLSGDTDDYRGGAFAKLHEIYAREYPDAFGGKRRVDAFGVDSGYRSNVVYAWTRSRVGTFALDGRDGWARPPLGAAVPVDVHFEGKKIANGAAIWPVGTWALKASLYSNLRKPGMKAGAEFDPPGFCHFGAWQDENFFLQLTSEYLGEEKHRGQVRKVWKKTFGRDNHLLDCRIYNKALADHLGLNRMTADDWAQLAAERGVPAELRTPELFAPRPVQIAARPDVAREGSAVAPAAEPDQAAGPVARPPGGFLDGYEVRL